MKTPNWPQYSRNLCAPNIRDAHSCRKIPITLIDPWCICGSITEHRSRPLNVCIASKYPDQVDPLAFRDVCYLLSVKTALYGRIVFGAAAVLFGVIALMWHDADTWQNLQHIWSLPFGTIIGGCLMTAQIAGGLGYSTRARCACLRSYFALSICVSR
jgi:hypothetical protein